MQALSNWLDSDIAKALGLVPPIPLYNKGSACSVNDPTASSSKAAAEATSARGAIKACELAGAILRNKDAKKGQQDVYRWFFENVLGYPIQFPDTSHVRFGSFGAAAGKLLLHLPIYITFLEHVHDAKVTGDFTNIEANLYKALQDPSTILELAVLAIYAETVSKPFMSYIRSRTATNGLLLGSYYQSVVAHCHTLAENPLLVIAPESLNAYRSYQDAALNGVLYDGPEVIYTSFSGSIKMATFHISIRRYLSSFAELLRDGSTSIPNMLMAGGSQMPRRNSSKLRLSHRPMITAKELLAALGSPISLGR